MSKVQLKVDSSQVHYSQGSFVRFCMNILPELGN